MKKEHRRIVIYPKDVVNITGLKPPAARTLLRNIRADLGKPPRAFVTISEFASYVQMPVSEIEPFLDLG